MTFAVVVPMTVAPISLVISLACFAVVHLGVQLYESGYRPSRRVLTLAVALLLAVSLARVAYAATVPNDPYCDWYGAWLFNWFYCH